MDASASPLCYTLVSHYVVRDIVVVIRTNYGDRESEKRGYVSRICLLSLDSSSQTGTRLSVLCTSVFPHAQSSLSVGS